MPQGQIADDVTDSFLYPHTARMTIQSQVVRSGKHLAVQPLKMHPIRINLRHSKKLPSHRMIVNNNVHEATTRTLNKDLCKFMQFTTF